MMTPTKMKLRVRKKEGGAKSSRRLLAETSPDSKCPICLDRFNNVASLDRCLHRFCFSCIHEWSKNKAECPLCKQPFSSIFHSVKAENDFKEFVLASVENGPPAPPAAGQTDRGAGSGRVRRPRASRGGERRSRRQQTPGPAPSSPDVRLEGLASLAEETGDPEQGVHHMMLRLTERRRSRVEEPSLRRLRDQDVVAFRRALYRTGVRVRGGSLNAGRQRDVSAAHLRRNPACLRRLLPWLQRELTVLYGSHGSLVSIVQHIIMSRITLHDMDDVTIRDELRPFLLARTDHFLHELVSFARSTLSIEAYDQQAVYECPAPSYEEDSHSDSSIIAISEDDDDDDAASEEIDITEDAAQDRVLPVPEVTETSLSQFGWDDETPGPSYSSLFPSPSQSQAEGQESAGAPVQASKAGRGCEDEEEEEECMIVGYVKPMAERTPELVQLSSNSSEEEPEEAAASEAVPLTIPKAETSSAQVPPPPPPPPPSLQSYLRPLSPSSCPYPPTSHSPPVHTRLGPQQTNSHQSHSRERDTERHSHHRRKQQHDFRNCSWSSSDSSVLSTRSGHTRSHRRSASHSRHHDQPSRDSLRWNLQSSGRSPTVSIGSDSTPDSSRSPTWEQTWSRDKLLPQRSEEERECARLVSARERSPQSSLYWDSPSHDGERKKGRKRRRRENEKERSRSPLHVSSTSHSRGRDSRRKRGRPELRLRKARRSTSSSITSSSSSVDSGSERLRSEKPAGKRKYKTRHLERAAQRQSSRRSSRDTGHPAVSSPAKKQRSQQRERSRSPSVEIIYERQASDVPSQTHRWRRKRHKKRSRRDAKVHSPTVITIDSDSDRTNDYQDCITEVTNSTADYQERVSEVSNSSPDSQLQVNKVTDSTTDHHNQAKLTHTRNDCQDQVIKSTKCTTDQVTDSSTDQQVVLSEVKNTDNLSEVTKTKSARQVSVPEVDNNTDNQLSPPDVNNRITDPQHGADLDRKPDCVLRCQNSDEDVPDTLSEALLSEASSSASAALAGPSVQSSSPVTPTQDSPDCTLNLEHCIVDVVDRESFNHSQNITDPEQTDRTDHSSVATITTTSDTRLLESILQELEDILPEEGQGAESRQEVAATGSGVNPESLTVPQRDQSDAGWETTENTATHASPAV